MMACRAEFALLDPEGKGVVPFGETLDVVMLARSGRRCDSSCMSVLASVTLQM